MSQVVILLGLGSPVVAQTQLSKCHGAFAEGTNRDQARFLFETSPKLISEKKVVEVAANASGKREADPLTAFQKYIDYLNYIYPRVSKNDQKREQITKSMIAPYIIQELPEKYIELQKQIARERGHGDITVTKEAIDQLLRMHQKEQIDSLTPWIDYLLSSDSSMYPVWTKVWIISGVVKLGKFDKEKGSFAKRTNDTVAAFPDLNREALANVVDWVVKALDKDTLKQIEALANVVDWAAEALDKNTLKQTEGPQLINIIKNKAQFGHWYAHAIKQLPSQHFDKSITTGHWVKYPMGSDPKPLEDSLANRGTGWCTAGTATAESQLMRGDFYVYYSNDVTGEPAHPRIAIRMENTKIGEIRGVERSQELDGEIAKTNILKDKLKDFGNEGKIYLKKDADMKMLTAIEKKHKNQKPLSHQEIEFIYEINGNIEGFGYGRDPRIDGIIKQRLNEHPEDIDLLKNLALGGNPSAQKRKSNFSSRTRFVDLIKTSGRSYDYSKTQQTQVRALRLLSEFIILNDSVMEVFLAAMKDYSDRVRETATNELRNSKSQDPRVFEAMLDATKDSDGIVRATALRAIGEIKFQDTRVLEALLAIAKGNLPQDRFMAIVGLGAFGTEHPRVMDALLVAMKDRDGTNRVQACWILGNSKSQDPRVLEAMLVAFKDKSERVVRRNAIIFLGEWKSQDSRIIEALLDAMIDSDNEVRLAALRSMAISNSRDPRVLEALLISTKDPHQYIRFSATKTLGNRKSQDPRILKALLSRVYDADLNISSIATRALRASNSQDPIIQDVLLKLGKDEDRNMRWIIDETQYF
jgi:HEAT repeat protein